MRTIGNLVYNIVMTRRAAPYVSLKRFGLPDISMPAIRRYARQIAERFKPDKIILFGSFAYGEPNEDSDVDLLVVMPCANAVTQAGRIRRTLRAPFAMDLIVRTPNRLQERLAAEDWFLREIIESGKVLYEKDHQRLGAQGRKRLPRRKGTRPGQASIP
jgi:predicted nucleotidyltransferase